MRVRDAENQSLLIGHYINFSIYFERYITKTVIWRKTDAEFAPEDLVNADNSFEKIPISIRRFLHNRIQNRLNMPLRPLSNLNNANDKDRSLHGWIEERISSIYKDKKLRACVDQYYVCYFYGDALNSNKVTESQLSNNINDSIAIDEHISTFMRIDGLAIEYDDDAVAFSATYTHYINKTESKQRKSITPNIYKGKVVRKNLTIQVFVEHDKFLSSSPRGNSTTGNFILLNFKIPQCNEDEATDTFNRYNYFEGIVSGLSDAHNDPLSFRALIIKRRMNGGRKKEPIRLTLKDKENRDDISKLVIEYFKNHVNQHQIKII
jgi:hypothetical protein